MLKWLAYQITTKFGEKDWFHSTPHTGVDYATPVGTPIESLTGGTISSVNVDPMLGECIRVDSGPGQQIVYGHLSQANIKQGTTIHQGDVIGLTGGTPGTPLAGHSTGPHLHITVLQNGSPVDPTALINANGYSVWDKISQPPNTGPGMSERILDWVLGGIGQGIHTIILIMPEVCGTLAMVFILLGMLGFKRAMHWAGTSALLAFVGVVLNAAIGQ